LALVVLALLSAPQTVQTAGILHSVHFLQQPAVAVVAAASHQAVLMVGTAVVAVASPEHRAVSVCSTMVAVAVVGAEAEAVLVGRAAITPPVLETVELAQAHILHGVQQQIPAYWYPVHIIMAAVVVVAGNTIKIQQTELPILLAVQVVQVAVGRVLLPQHLAAQQ
jgi:hypothetical protein